MADCAALTAERQRLLKAMWASPILTAKRANYERQANAVAKQLTACKRTARGKGATQGKGAIGKEAGAPEAMWASAPASRPIGVLGVVQMVTSPNGSTDAILSVAMGHRPGVFTPLEDRSTLLGALAALHAAGYDYPNPDDAGLKAKFGTKTSYDPRIISAAKLTGSLSSAAAKMRKIVSDKGLGKAAWGYRVLYMFSALPTLQGVQGTLTGLLALIPIVGPVIAGIEAGHMGITSQLVAAYAAKAKGYVQQGLKSAHPAPSGPPPGALPAYPAAATPLWMWIAGGGVVVAGAAAIVSRKSATGAAPRSTS